ncbi:glucosidase II beta subunit-like-domain-containing protein [Myxozyma melibiosi]|uniref:Glucosidase 2 subunit beta n=1 Tax=Myxozyma melibiosi TaxID=54550 RepID=A0ABR1F8M5_9ASCO
MFFKAQKVCTAIAASFLIVQGVDAVKSKLIRGVSSEDQALYVPNEAGYWACLGHKDILIPISKINDDYCDCPDGSDEPGTSACANGKFHCQNKGHVPGVLPSYQVNDGICDYDLCCDGSDEWAGLVKCENKCREMAAELQKREAENRKAQIAGWTARTKLATKAASLKASLLKEQTQIEAQLKAAHARVEKAEEAVKMAEVSSSMRVGKKGNPYVERLKERVLEYQRAKEAMASRIAALELRLQETEVILLNLKNDYNPNYNDEAVKQAVKTYSTLLEAPLPESNYAELSYQLSAESDDELLKEEVEDNDPDLVDYNSYIPIEWRVWIHTKKRELVDFLVEHGLLAHRDISETSDVKTAKKELDEANKQVQELDKKAQKIADNVAADFGPDDIFRALAGDCITAEVGDYTYELCFNQKSIQKPKNGMITPLGKFDRYEGNKIYYTGGAKCWNGPQRSTVVEMRCGEKNKLLSVSEPAMCEYLFRITSPAMCTDPEANESGKVRDEL